MEANAVAPTWVEVSFLLVLKCTVQFMLNYFLGQISRSIDRSDRFGVLLWARRSPPPSGFCDPMRLSAFIDFISVEREREDRRELLTTTTIPLSQLEATDRGAVVCNSVCQRWGSQSH